MIFSFGKNKTLTIVVTVLIEAGLTLTAVAVAKGSFLTFVGGLIFFHVAIIGGAVIAFLIAAKLRGNKVAFHFGFRRRPARPTRR